MQKKKIPLVILFCGWLAAVPLLTCLLPAEDFSEREKDGLRRAWDFLRGRPGSEKRFTKEEGTL